MAMSSQSWNLTHREGRARLALAVDGIEDLLLRSTAVVVCPEHVGIPTAGDDAGAFRDARVAFVRDQSDARRELLAGLGLATLQAVSGENRKEESSRVLILFRAMLCLFALG